MNKYGDQELEGRQGLPRPVQNLHQLSAASGGFEQRQYIRDAEQFQNLLARVHYFQPAAARPGRNVQRYHRSQSRAIHHRNFFQVQHDTHFSLAGFAHRVFQQRHTLAGQSSGAFQDRAIFRLFPLDSKSRPRTDCVVSRHSGPPLGATLEAQCLVPHWDAGRNTSLSFWQ